MLKLMRKGRRLQFTLSTLFTVVTALACWLGYELNWIRQRHVALQSGYCGVVGGTAPGYLAVFGERGYVYIWRPGGLARSEMTKRSHIESLFPEAVVEK